MSLTREQVIAYIEGLTAEELGELTSELMQRLGQPATEPAPPSFTMGALPPTPWYDEDTSVVLRSFGRERIAVIKAVRELWGLGLDDARRLVESAPIVLREGLNRMEAQAAAERLTSAGAEVELR
ncbi:50S ribosomal protein L7/L12 [Sorangium sp. So ce726]|uniref:ribosomal protein bL12 n=1 Tax=Sorangium sp. So ce726 TaxID=3133319 RepID=UPI003F5E9162